MLIPMSEADLDDGDDAFSEEEEELASDFFFRAAWHVVNARVERLLNDLAAVVLDDDGVPLVLATALW